MKAESDAENDQLELQEAPGRIGAAWGVLRGRYVVDVQLQAQWAEYQIAFTDILTKLNAYLARLSRLQKQEAERELEAPQLSLQAAPARKAELYRRANALRGLMTNGGTNVRADQES